MSSHTRRPPNRISPPANAPTWEVVRRVAVYLRPYKLLAVTTVLCAVLSLLASFAFPKLTAYAIDDVIRPGKVELLMPVMLGLIGAFLLRDLFNAFRILVNNHFEQNVIFDMRREVYARLQRLPVGYFDQRASGDLMTRVIEDVNSVERVLIDGTEQGVVALVGVLGVGAILFYQNPLLALGGDVAHAASGGRRALVHAHGAQALSPATRSRQRHERPAHGQSPRRAPDQSLRPRAARRHAFRANGPTRLRQSTLGIMRVWAIYQPVMGFAGAIGIALVLWIGGRMVDSGNR